jgi:hypothetical protein
VREVRLAAVDRRNAQQPFPAGTGPAPPPRQVACVSTRPA